MARLDTSSCYRLLPLLRRIVKLLGRGTENETRMADAKREGGNDYRSVRRRNKVSTMENKTRRIKKRPRHKANSNDSHALQSNKQILPAHQGPTIPITQLVHTKRTAREDGHDGEHLEAVKQLH